MVARAARFCVTCSAPCKRRVARRTLPVLWVVPHKALAAPVLAADLNATPNNVALRLAHAVNAHEVRVTAHIARLPVCARPALRHARDARLLVSVEPRGADVAPAVLCKDTALPRKRPVAVARVVRQEESLRRVARRAERRVERTRRAALIACWM